MDGDFSMKKICAAAVFLMLLLILCSAALADAFVFPADLTEIGEEAFFGVTGLEEAVLPAGIARIGALRQSKFRVLTSSAHMEYSYGHTKPDFPHTLFTYGLTLAVGTSGPMPCDTNGDGQASLTELQRYITDFHDPEYLNETQHVQAYPAGSDYALFYRTAQ